MNERTKTHKARGASHDHARRGVALSDERAIDLFQKNVIIDWLVRHDDFKNHTLTNKCGYSPIVNDRYVHSSVDCISSATKGHVLHALDGGIRRHSRPLMEQAREDRKLSGDGASCVGVVSSRFVCVVGCSASRIVSVLVFALF
jgi:hypothetical protein